MVRRRRRRPRRRRPPRRRGPVHLRLPARHRARGAVDDAHGGPGRGARVLRDARRRQGALRRRGRWPRMAAARRGGQRGRRGRRHPAGHEGELVLRVGRADRRRRGRRRVVRPQRLAHRGPGVAPRPHRAPRPHAGARRRAAGDRRAGWAWRRTSSRAPPRIPRTRSTSTATRR